MIHKDLNDIFNLLL